MDNYENISQHFKIKVALDTNILSYLLDETFPNINSFIKILSNNPFVDVTCSCFTIYELIGVRKLEHYLRTIHTTATANNSVMNFSSALRYKNDWNSPELNYKDTYLPVKENVEEDLAKINDAFGISFDYEGLHSELWAPHQELVLSSKISKEDSLVLLSSVFPSIDRKEDHLIFLTNDDRFYRAYCGDEKISEIDDIFTNHNIIPPIAYKINNLSCPTSNTLLNLLQDSTTEEQVSNFTNQFIYEYLAKKYNSLYLGKTLACEANAEAAKDLFCFELAEDKELNEDIYVSIISKDLSTVYNFPKKLSNFWCYEEITSYPYKSDSENPHSNRISTKIQTDDISADKLQLLQAQGNLIFIHPDSID